MLRQTDCRSDIQIVAKVTAKFIQKKCRMKQFNPGIDLETINHWLELRGEEKMLRGNLPMIGLIEPDIAVGFLFQAECHFCFLDGFVTNPEAKSEKRSLAIDEITRQLIRQAKLLGFANVAILTKQPSLVDRAEKLHGFTKKDLQFLTLGV